MFCMCQVGGGGWVIFKAGGVVGVTLGGMFFLLYIVESFGRGASYIVVYLCRRAGGSVAS